MNRRIVEDCIDDIEERQRKSVNQQIHRYYILHYIKRPTEFGKQIEAREILDFYYQETRNEEINHNHLGMFEAFNIFTSLGRPLTFVGYLLCARLFDAISSDSSLVFP